MPPTLQILTYSTGAAFLVGRSAACALATATMPAAEPSSMLFMSVMCDLQLDMVGVGSLLTFDFRGPTANPNQSKVVSPSLPFDLDHGALPLQMPSTLRDREAPAHPSQDTFSKFRHNRFSSQTWRRPPFPERCCIIVTRFRLVRDTITFHQLHQGVKRKTAPLEGTSRLHFDRLRRPAGTRKCVLMTPIGGVKIDRER